MIEDGYTEGEIVKAGPGVHNLFFLMFVKREDDNYDGPLEGYPHENWRMAGIVSGGSDGELPPRVLNMLQEGEIILVEMNEVLFGYFELRNFILQTSNKVGDMDKFFTFMEHIGVLEAGSANKIEKTLDDMGLLNMPPGVGSEDGTLN